MPEQQDMPKQPLSEEIPADAIEQDSTISLSETQTPDMEVHHHPDIHHKSNELIADLHNKYGLSNE